MEEECGADRVRGDVDGVSALFIGKKAPITNKVAAGCPQDFADLDALYDTV